MRKLVLDSKGILPILDRPDRKIYIYIHHDRHYFKLYKENNLYFISEVNRTTGHRTARPYYEGTFYKYKTAQETLQAVLKDFHDNVYEFNDLNEFLKSTI